MLVPCAVCSQSSPVPHMQHALPLPPPPTRVCLARCMWVGTGTVGAACSTESLRCKLYVVPVPDGPHVWIRCLGCYCVLELARRVSLVGQCMQRKPRAGPLWCVIPLF